MKSGALHRGKAVQGGMRADKVVKKHKHGNEVVRRFFPKGRSFDNITDEQVAFVEQWINNLPRKIFNYRSSNFIFHNVLFDIAI